MRKSLLLALFALLFTSLNAQDVITKQNGDEISAKVIEINDNEVKYKSYDNLDGPVYVLKKSEVFLIKYQNGTKDVFSETTVPANTSATVSHIDKNRDGLLVFSSHKNVYLDGKKMSRDDLLALYEQNNAEESIELIKTGYDKKSTSCILACTGGVFLITSIPLYINYMNNTSRGGASLLAAYLFDMGGTALCIAAIGINAAGNARIKNSFKAYNKIVREKRNEVTLSFNVVNNGVGVRLNF